MTYPPPPPGPGAPPPPPPPDPGHQPTQAIPGSYTPTPGSPGPAAYVPAPGGGGYQPPPPPGYQTGGGGYTPGPPPGRNQGLSSGAIVGIAAVILVAVLVAGIGIFLVTRDDGDGPSESTTTTTEDEASSESSESSESSSSSSTTTTTEPEEEFSIDGGTSASGFTDGSSRFHDVFIPDGVTVTMTVTPIDAFDVVAEADGQTFDRGLAGEPEVIEVNGPDDFTLAVFGFEGAAGEYEITLEEQ